MPPKEPKAPRPPSAYNLFMREKLSGWKKAHPGVDHKEAFKAVAALWATAVENPKNRHYSQEKMTVLQNEGQEKYKAISARNDPSTRSQRSSAPVQAPIHHDDEEVDHDDHDKDAYYAEN